MSELLILIPQGRHSLQRNEHVCQVVVGVGVGGWSVGGRGLGWGREGEGEGWRGGGWGGVGVEGVECGGGVGGWIGEVRGGGEWGVQRRGTSKQGSDIWE